MLSKMIWIDCPKKHNMETDWSILWSPFSNLTVFWQEKGTETKFPAEGGL